MSMLDFQQIKDQYPEHLQGFERAILREYLQYKVLQAIFESHHACKLVFLGGTALRIVHETTAFLKTLIWIILVCPGPSLKRSFRK